MVRSTSVGWDSTNVSSWNCINTIRESKIMATNIKDIIDNTKDIFVTDSSLDTLLDFERVLDELDLYAFKHWKLGELVEGPVYEKYFVTCTFMWPHKLMPDPRGGERLLSYDCEVTYEESMLEVPKKVETPDDFVPGGKMPKMTPKPVWLVTIVMPKDLMKDIRQGSLELESSNIDMEDVEQAYEEGDDNDVYQDQQNQMDQQQPQPEQQNVPPAF